MKRKRQKSKLTAIKDLRTKPEYKGWRDLALDKIGEKEWELAVKDTYRTLKRDGYSTPIVQAAMRDALQEKILESNSLKTFKV